MSSVAILRYDKRKKPETITGNCASQNKTNFAFISKRLFVSRLPSKKGRKCSEFLKLVFHTNAQTF